MGELNQPVEPRSPWRSSLSPETPEREQPGAAFDRDIAMIEELPDPVERGRYALDLLEEVTGAQMSGLYRGERDLPVVTGRTDWSQQYYLYEIPDGQGGDPRTIREVYDDSRLQRTAKHVFGRVDQGKMRVIDRAQGPYLELGMSECSALIAVQPDRLWVAHLSYSMTTAAEQVVDLMRQQGVASDQLYAVASVGASQEQRAAAIGGELGRRLRLEDYIRLGVQPDRMVPFEFDWEVKAGQEPVARNLVRVLVSSQAVYVKLADYSSQQGAVRQEVQQGPDRAERVLVWPEGR